MTALQLRRASVRKGTLGRALLATFIVLCALLAYPLLLIIAAGTVDSPVGLQLAGGIVATLVAVRLFIVPEWHDLARAWERLRRAGLSAVAPAGIAVLVMALSAFRVHGVRNLYVCHASVFPTTIRINPMLTVMAMADYAWRKHIGA